jgi:hypothetical protein
MLATHSTVGVLANAGKPIPFHILIVFKELRWNSWQVLRTDFTVLTYNVTENQADRLILNYDSRKLVITLYVRSVLYFLTKRDELDFWISTNSPFSSLFDSIDIETKIDSDPLFSSRFDEDFDETLDGISVKTFLAQHGSMLDTFITKRSEKMNIKYDDEEKRARIIKLAYMVSLVARRSLALNDGTHSGVDPDLFLERLHQLFKGDYRVHSINDEWIFGDFALLGNVIAPGLRAGLRLFQDHFAGVDPNDPDSVFEALDSDYKDMIICHEGDPAWRDAILADEDSLFSLRKKNSEVGRDQHKHYMLMLSREPRKFSIIKLNKESVRSLWSGQQHELVFLGSETPERGSIQQMKYVLRNIINSSMDVPIGYPAFISPLITAYW